MTQCERILDYMKQHGGITAAEAFHYCGSTRLSARIFDLRRQGYDIRNESVTSKNRFGEKVRFDRYVLGET